MFPWILSQKDLNRFLISWRELFPLFWRETKRCLKEGRSSLLYINLNKSPRQMCIVLRRHGHEDITEWKISVFKSFSKVTEAFVPPTMYFPFWILFHFLKCTCILPKMPILKIGILSMHLSWWHRLLNFSRPPPPPPPVDFSSQSRRTVPGIPPRREAGYGWARGDWSQNIVYWVLQMYLGGGGASIHDSTLTLSFSSLVTQVSLCFFLLSWVL